MSILDDIAALINAVVSWLAGITQTAVNAIATAINTAVLWFQGAVVAIRDWLGQLYSTLVTYITRIAGQVQSAVVAALAELREFAARLWFAVQDATVAVIGRIGAYIADTVAVVRAFVWEAIGTLANFTSSVLQAVRGAVEGVFGAVGRVVDTLKTAITGVVDDVVTVVKAALVKLRDVAVQAIEIIIGPTGSFVSTLGERLANLRTAFVESFTGLAQSITHLDDTLVKQFQSFVEVIFDSGGQSTAELGSLYRLLTTGAASPRVTSPQELLAAVQGALARIPSSAWYVRGPALVLLVTLAAVPSVLGLAQMGAEPALQVFRKEFPTNLIAPPDVAVLWRLGLIDRVAAVDVIQRQGYTVEDAGRYLDLTQAVPPTGDLLALWLRDLVTDEDLTRALHRQGFAPEWQARLRAASALIPPVQDLITMAVREAFTPEIAERFGQFENFPPAFAEWGAKQGLTEDWSRRYWAAHWSLPSAEQGFDMLHRRKPGTNEPLITPQELDLLLRALDVMPFWRDKLTQIAFHPFTRVDIRRMHQQRVLSDREVLVAHLELGYDQFKAELLTEFVLKLNRRAPAEDDEELGRLSRTTILGFYEDGLLTKERAKQLLVDLRHTPEAADLYLQGVDLEGERKDRKAEADLIIDMAEAGTLTFAQAADKLRQAGLEQIEVERALTRLLRAEQRKVKLPSQNDGEKFYLARFITAAQYRDLLIRQGYAAVWADAFIKLADLEKPRAS